VGPCSGMPDLEEWSVEAGTENSLFYAYFPLPLRLVPFSIGEQKIVFMSWTWSACVKRFERSCCLDRCLACEWGKHATRVSPTAFLS